MTRRPDRPMRISDLAGSGGYPRPNAGGTGHTQIGPNDPTVRASRIVGPDDITERFPEVDDPATAQTVRQEGIHTGYWGRTQVHNPTLPTIDDYGRTNVSVRRGPLRGGVRTHQLSDDVAADHLRTDEGGSGAEGINLRDVLRNIYFYSRTGFFVAIVVFVLGIVWWTNQRVSSSVGATIIKKDLVATWWQPEALPDNWQRTPQADQSVMESEDVGRLARRIVVVLGKTESSVLARLADDSDDPSNPESPPRDREAPVSADASDFESFGRASWLMLPPGQTEFISTDTTREATDGTILIRRSLATVLARAYLDVRDSGQEAFVQRIAEIYEDRNISGVVSVRLNNESGEIHVSAGNNSPSVAAFFANLLPIAFIAASDRDVVMETQEELRLAQTMYDNADDNYTTETRELSSLESRLYDQLAALVPENSVPTRMSQDAMRMQASEWEQQRLALQTDIARMQTEEQLYAQQLIIQTDPLRLQIQELEDELRLRGTTERDNGPMVRTLRIRLNGLRQALEERGDDEFRPVTNIYSQRTEIELNIVRAKLTEARTQVATLDRQIDSIGIQIEAFPEYAAPMKTQAQKVETARSVMEREAHALQEARQKAANVPEHFEWKTSARASDAITGSKAHYLVVIVVFSLCAGLLTVRLASMLDSRVQTEVQARAIVPARVLSSIPQLGRSHRFICRDTDEGRQTNSFVYNLFGILSLNLRHLGFPKRGKLLSVTSTQPNEGKSFVSFNLATYYAMQGMQTCLLHSDYRHARLDMFPDLDPDSIPGFVELLAGNGEIHAIDQCLYPTDIDNLYVCPPGRITAQPAQIVDGEGFSDLLEDLRDRFDVVIIDCAPMLLVVDAAIVARQTDATLLVVGLGTVRKHALATCLDRLALQNVRLAGMVVNRDRMSSASYYYREYGDLIPVPTHIPVIAEGQTTRAELSPSEVQTLHAASSLSASPHADTQLGGERLPQDESAYGESEDGRDTDLAGRMKRVTRSRANQDAAGDGSLRRKTGPIPSHVAAADTYVYDDPSSQAATYEDDAAFSAELGAAIANESRSQLLAAVDQYADQHASRIPIPSASGSRVGPGASSRGGSGTVTAPRQTGDGGGDGNDYVAWLGHGPAGSDRMPVAPEMHPLGRTEDPTDYDPWSDDNALAVFETSTGEDPPSADSQANPELDLYGGPSDDPSSYESARPSTMTGAPGMSREDLTGLQGRGATRGAGDGFDGFDTSSADETDVRRALDGGDVEAQDTDRTDTIYPGPPGASDMMPPGESAAGDLFGTDTANDDNPWSGGFEDEEQDMFAAEPTDEGDQAMFYAPTDTAGPEHAFDDDESMPLDEAEPDDDDEDQGPRIG